jgi:hypothetical protein
LQLLIFNEELLVSAFHQNALITSLPFVHTARRTYRLDFQVKTLDFADLVERPSVGEIVWTSISRGRWSRNKVIVGEPAMGSFSQEIKVLGMFARTGRVSEQNDLRKEQSFRGWNTCMLKYLTNKI